MTTPLFHPDQLGPGSRVGPWRVLESLGAGGFGRAFKVERDEQPGQPYMLKVALRPASPHAPEEENVHGRLSREAAIHMAYDTGVKLHSVDHWPTPQGYLYFVTDYVEGETFHEWCWRTQPSAARLMDIFTEVVRQVGALHRRGVSHRDLKSDNILIRTVDETPHLLDYGAARLPGMATLTVGVPPTAPHLVPPECLEFLHEETWKEGARFDPGMPGDLYALGLLFFEALTDSYAFDPKLPYNALVVVIMAKTPAAPHVLNPKVPRSLSDIVMRLLEKRPEARYPSAEALLQALWEAAKERKKPEWQVSLAMSPPAENAPPPETPGPSALPVSPAADAPPSADAAQVPQAATEGPERAEVAEAPHAPATERAPETPVAVSSRPRRRLLTWGLRGLAVLFLALWVGLSTLPPTPEKGSPSMPTAPTPHAPEARRSSITTLLAAALCSVTSMGCPAAQVKPERGDCPKEAREAMFRVLDMDTGKGRKAVVDINQPGDQSQRGTYQDGPVVGRVVGYSWTDPTLPDGTLLYGRLWTGFEYFGDPAAMVRYSEAKLPDGRTFPVCLVLGGRDGLVPVLSGSKAGAAVLPRELPLTPVDRWP
ncbi:serine/threonine protein kinase [Pyxidicoccus caerfyrddinensis]|uniref:serine/threonine protein kinase n=1 Tax=Pyxidicoccus caerfyrddinensis TaxID=2709663 RepID=UPI0013DC99F6|nr:serine/threonine-protein kinase [Pyxidicoccus caerfyrddinensis]